MIIPERTTDGWVSASLIAQGVKGLWLDTTNAQAGGRRPDIEVTSADRVVWLEMKGLGGDAQKPQITFGGDPDWATQRKALVEQQECGVKIVELLAHYSWFFHRRCLQKPAWFGWVFYCLPDAARPYSDAEWTPFDFAAYPSTTRLVCPCVVDKSVWSIPLKERTSRNCQLSTTPGMQCLRAGKARFGADRIVERCASLEIGLPIWPMAKLRQLKTQPPSDDLLDPRDEELLDLVDHGLLDLTDQVLDRLPFNPVVASDGQEPPPTDEAPVFDPPSEIQQPAGGTRAVLLTSSALAV